MCRTLPLATLCELGCFPSRIEVQQTQKNIKRKRERVHSMKFACLCHMWQVASCHLTTRNAACCTSQQFVLLVAAAVVVVPCLCLVLLQANHICCPIAYCVPQAGGRGKLPSSLSTRLTRMKLQLVYQISLRVTCKLISNSQRGSAFK